MALAEGHKRNFATLKAAFAAGRVCLLECTDAKTGESVAVICAENEDGKETTMVPFARMFNGNPYEELISPLAGEEQNGG